MSFEKNTPERKAAAKGIRGARNDEMKVGLNAYALRRRSDEYIMNLRGLRHLFKYVRTLASPTVLDIGAGSTIGIRQISQLPWAQGISFEATTLTRSSKVNKHFPGAGSIAGLVEENLGWDKTHITSVEELRGIPDESKGAVIQVYSLPYSKAPGLAIKSINRVLVPGGVFKGYFPKEGGVMEATPFAPFEEEFRKHGYDMHTIEMEKGFEYMILLAIKPGNPDAPAAKDLSKLDEAEVDDQVNDARDEQRA